MCIKCAVAALAIAVTFAFAADVSAQVHSGDVIVDVQDGAVVTGTVNDGLPRFPWRVWQENFGSAGFPNFAADPGYDALSGTFTPGHVVGLSIRKALRVWDDKEGHFLTIPKETMQVSRFSMVIETPPVDPDPGNGLPSLALGQANASGMIHIHPNYFLTAPHGEGVYLLELEFWVDTDGIEPSQPFWIVFNQLQPQHVVSDAVAWVENNLIGDVCPADFNGDGVVDVSDMLVLLGAWGHSPGHHADLNGDGVVDVSDLLLLLGAWGACSS